MIYWTIAVSVLGVGCIALGIACGWMRAQLHFLDRRDGEAEELRRELDTARGGELQFRRESAGLRRALEAADARQADAEQELAAWQQRALEAEARAERAESRRIAAEKDVYAGRMRADMLEKEIGELELAMENQERMYQDILRERDRTLAQLQQDAPKRRPRKKPDVLDEQITLNDILADSVGGQ